MQEAYKAFWLTLEIGAVYAQPQLAQKVKEAGTNKCGRILLGFKISFENSIFYRFIVNIQFEVLKPNSEGFIIDLE